MRSLTDLQAQAIGLGIAVLDADSNPLHREQIMDAIRDKTGDFDPSVQLDPAKAQDLKNSIDWTLPGRERFVSVEKAYAEGWVAEPKLDGARLRLFMGAASNTMNSGRRSDMTYAYIERANNFPHLRDAVIPELAGTVLDGELMPPVSSLTTVSGVTTKGTLNSAMALLNVEPAKSVATQAKYGRAIFMAFDVLMVAGESVMHWPATKRREALEVIVATMKARHVGLEIKVISQHPVNADVLQGFLDQGYEGAMLKKDDHQYLPGKRMHNWQKVKVMGTVDLHIIGSVDGKGRNAGKVGSLQVAWRDEDGVDHYCADVAGISDAFRDELTGPDGKVAPEFIGKVIEVMTQGRTKNGRLRHPHYVRSRPDKTPVDCGRDQFESVPEA